MNDGAAWLLCCCANLIGCCRRCLLQPGIAGVCGRDIRVRGTSGTRWDICSVVSIGLVSRVRRKVGGICGVRRVGGVRCAIRVVGIVRAIGAIGEISDTRTQPLLRLLNAIFFLIGYLPVLQRAGFETIDAALTLFQSRRLAIRYLAIRQGLLNLLLLLHICIDECIRRVRGCVGAASCICTGRIRTSRVRTCRIRTCRIRTCRIRTCRIRTCRIRTCRIRTCRIRTCRIRTCRIRTCRIRTCRVCASCVRTISRVLTGACRVRTAVIVRIPPAVRACGVDSIIPPTAMISKPLEPEELELLSQPFEPAFELEPVPSQFEFPGAGEILTASLPSAFAAFAVSQEFAESDEFHAAAGVAPRPMAKTAAGMER